MREQEWVADSVKPMLFRERHRLGTLRGRTVASVYLNGHMDVLEVEFTDGSVVRIDAGSTNSGRARMSSRVSRRRRT